MLQHLLTRMNISKVCSKRKFKKFYVIIIAIRSGDYYMFDYESDEEEDEGKQDEATAAQEQVY